MSSMTTSSVVFCGLLCLAQMGNAQIVRRGPGGEVRVWAPFVRVEVGPNGTYVRAPFTSVYSPRYRGRVIYDRYPHGPHGVQEAAPAPVRESERDLAQNSLPEVRNSLVESWSRLRKDLGRFANGTSWQNYLQLPTAMDTEAASLELKELLQKYDRVTKASQYRAIAGLASFQATRRLLAVYLDRLTKASMEVPPPPPPPPPENLPRPLREHDI